MHVLHDIPFEIELSAKDRDTLKRVLDVPCEIEKLAKLTVTVKVELQERQPKPEAPAP